MFRKERWKKYLQKGFIIFINCLYQVFFEDEKLKFCSLRGNFHDKHETDNNKIVVTKFFKGSA